LSEPLQLGPMSPAALDFVMCCVCDQMRVTALGVIEQYEAGKLDLSVERVTGYDGTPAAEVRTRADTEAQKVACVMLDKFLPGWGRVGEENLLQVACTLSLPANAVVDVTIDPLDGTEWLTKVLAARSGLPRENVYTMLAVRVNGVPVAAYMMSLFNGVLYRVGPGENVIRMSGDAGWQDEVIPPRLPPSLTAGTLGYHRSAEFHPVLRWLLSEVEGGNEHAVFGSFDAYEGSIGGDLLRMVKGVTVAMARRPTFYTPWDDSPLALFCKAASIRVFEIRPDGLYEVKPVVPLTDPVKMPHGLLYVHGQYVDELGASYRSRRRSARWRRASRESIPRSPGRLFIFCPAPVILVGSFYHLF
jgi:fructose-1,6-bisphosphatase/inositol monophosphatase family enzyme